jgi:hypothetical protein
MNIPLEKVWTQSTKRSNLERILAFDPGETTGVFFLKRMTIGDQAVLGSTTFLSETNQADTSTLGLGHKAVDHLINHYQPDIVVCEDYRVYGWKTNQHSWAALHTPKLIGVIVSLCEAYQKPIVMQMAIQAKGFCTDDKLRFWNMYSSGKRHGNDAARHALFYLLFGGKNEQRSKG